MNGLSQPGLMPAAPVSVTERLAKAVTDFNSSLASSNAGSLAQVWLPEVGEDGSIVLNCQGLPYAINGTGDLLALFRCISCKYKFATDLTKPQLMGAVGRVFTSGEPEMSHNVQQYDRTVFLRAAEAQRCRIASALFMPLYHSPKRDCVLGVFEVVQTEREVTFPAIVDWLRCCLHELGLYTADVDKHSYIMGLRQMPPEYNVSAFESGTAAVYHQQQQQRHLAAAAGDAPGSMRWGAAAAAAATAQGSMAPPPLPTSQAPLRQPQAQGQQPRQAEVEQQAGEAEAAGARAARPLPAGRVPLPAHPSRSDPTSERTATASGCAAAPAQPRQAPEAQAEHDAQGDTLMESNGHAVGGACDGQRADARPGGSGARPGPASLPLAGQAQQAQQADQLQPRGQDSAPAGVACLAAGGDVDEEEDEDEVMQPAKLQPALPPKSALQPCSGALGQSSGARTSAGEGGTAGVGSHHGMPSPGGQHTTLGGSGHSSHTDKRDGGGSNPSNHPASGQGTASPSGQPQGAGAGGQQLLLALPASDGSDRSAGALGALPHGALKLERVGTTTRLEELEHARREQQLGSTRPSSAPPPGATAAAAAVAAAAAWHGSPQPELSHAPGVPPRHDLPAAALQPSPEVTAMQTLAAMLAQQPVQQQQQGRGMPGLPPLAQQAQQQQQLGQSGKSSVAQPVPAAAASPALASMAALGVPSLPPAADGPPGMADAVPGGTLMQQSQAPTGAGGPSSAGGGGTDLARMGSQGGELSRLNSGGARQKNLTIEDLQAHFGYGLKEAASRLGICPTTLKRTCRRMGISRWPRRQLVRLTKEHLAAAKVLEPLERLTQPQLPAIGRGVGRPLTASDGSGSGDGLRPGGAVGGAPPPPPVQLALRSAAAAAAGLPPLFGGGPGAGPSVLVTANPALLLALQQAQAQTQAAGKPPPQQQQQQQQRGEGGDGRAEAGGALPLGSPASLHQQLLQLQQRPGPPAGNGLQGLNLRINPAQLLSLQQQLAAVAATAGARGSSPSPAAGAAPPPPAGLPLVQAAPAGAPGGFAEAGPSGPPPGLFRHRSAQRLPLEDCGRADGGVGGPPGGAMPWGVLPPALAGPHGLKQESGSVGYPLFAAPLGEAQHAKGGLLGQHSQGPPRPFPRETPTGPAFSGLGGSPWQLPPRSGGAAVAAPGANGDAGQYAELAAAAAAANVQQLSGYGQPQRQHHPAASPQRPHATGLSLGSIPHLGDHLHLGMHSAESLDILAGADFDSVANSPRPAISNLGGLSNLGLSNFGLSNLELPGAGAGGAGPEFSVGGPPGPPFAGATSSQRP